MLSWGEIFIVFFIALLLFGADKIPEFARTAGKMMGEYRKVRDSLREEIESVKDELDDAKHQVETYGDDEDDSYYGVEEEDDDYMETMRDVQETNPKPEDV